MANFQNCSAVDNKTPIIIAISAIDRLTRICNVVISFLRGNRLFYASLVAIASDPPAGALLGKQLLFQRIFSAATRR